jgi:hypothetical protein
MRVSTLRQAGDEQQAQELEEFAAFLQRVGEGTEQEYPDLGEPVIRVPLTFVEVVVLRPVWMI